MSKTLGAVADTKGAKIEIKEFVLRPLGPNDVEIDIDCSGLCHTDVHMVNDDWSCSAFPIVPGHEGIGKVCAMGPGVRMLKMGQTVGVGWIRDSCGHCRNCLKGEENICIGGGYVGTYVGIHPGGILNQGTWAKKIRINERFAYPIPDKLDPVKIAPMLCAGMTVFNPLRRFITHPSMKVGVVGIGGLGHLAVKFARAMGAEVTAFSGSADKEEAVKAMGAHNFVVMTDRAQMKKAENTQDLIVDVSPSPISWQAFLACLRIGGTLALVGLPVDYIPVPTTTLIFSQKRVCGSIVGGGAITKEMLDLCANNQIYPEVKVMNFKDVQEACDTIAEGKVRFRIVLKWMD